MRIGKPLGNGLAQRVKVRDAAIVRNGNLAIESHSRQPSVDKWPERLSEEPRAVVAISAEQHELAVTRKNGD